MSKRFGELEIEPLSERRWAEIEKKVIARREIGVAPPAVSPPARGWQLGWAALSAAALVAVAWVWAGGRPRDALSREVARVVTEGASAHTMAGDVFVEVGAHSSVLVIEEAPERWLVSIEHGRAGFRVPPRRGRPSFRVDAGLVRVEVIGTRFTVEREAGSASALVMVDEGTVQVTSGAGEARVGAGERWPTEIREQEQESSPEARRDVALGSSPESEVESSREAEVPRLASPRPRRSARERQLPGSEEVIAASAAGGSFEAPASAASAADRPPARERFSRAEALERTEPERALAEYESLAHEGGAWGANALFAQGRLELELGRRERARALFEHYLARFPTGWNVDDARQLLERAR